MGYRCTNKMGASPCIEDSRFNRDSKSGLVDGKVVRKNRFVPYNKVTNWVDPSSRKFFEPTDDATKRQDKADRKWLIEQLQDMNIDGRKIDLPEDVTLCELGEAYNKYDTRLNIAIDGAPAQKKRTLGLVGTSDNQDETEKVEIKQWLDDHNVTYHNRLGLSRLRETKQDHEKIIEEEGE